MPKMRNKMESSDGKFAEEVLKLNESSQQLNAQQIPSVLGENM